MPKPLSNPTDVEHGALPATCAGQALGVHALLEVHRQLTPAIHAALIAYESLSDRLLRALFFGAESDFLKEPTAQNWFTMVVLAACVSRRHGQPRKQ
jgi:hypothetical protein